MQWFAKTYIYAILNCIVILLIKNDGVNWALHMDSMASTTAIYCYDDMILLKCYKYI